VVTPAALARSAISSPTRGGGDGTVAAHFALSASTVEAAAIVTPASSSITCTEMCLFDRNTARRGRAAVPWTFLRTRR
jgi:hypothetical protein